MHLRGMTFTHVPLPPESYPFDAPVRVRTFGERCELLDFVAFAAGPSSETHLRVRTDDGLVFAVPAGDCELLEGATP